MTNYTPLRYPGGKGRFSSYIKQIIELNGLSRGHYIEPFVGGAGVALNLLLNECVEQIHINDVDYNIYSFWHSVLNETEELCKLINDTPVSVDVWRQQKNFLNSDDQSILSKGFATFFLNRTNRSGILKAGVIGGYNQTGEWKIDARYNKKDLVQRIKKIASYKNKISLYNVDACKFLKDIPPKIKVKSLIYLDPPYYVKGQGLYQNHYKHEDHEILAEAIAKIKRHNWVVSYDNVPEIKLVYQNYRQEEFSLNYSVGVHSKGSEVMIFQDNLITPAKIQVYKNAA